MEELYEILKTFLTTTFNNYLEELEDDDITLPLITEKNIVFGSIDLSRYEMPVICSIIPENQQIENDSISEWNESSRVTIGFICQKDTQNVLLARMCRYAKALKKALMNDYTLDGAIENNKINNINYFDDAGTLKNQMTIAEVQVTFITANEYE